MFIVHFIITCISTGQWMDDRCKLGLLDILSTAAGKSDDRGIVGPSYSQVFGTFFSLPSVFLSLFIFAPSSSVSKFYFFLAVPNFPCTSVWEKPLQRSSTFPIAILNGTCSLHSAQTGIRSECRVVLSIQYQLNSSFS